MTPLAEAHTEAEVLAALERCDLAALLEEVCSHLEAAGASFGRHGPVHVDPVPRIFAAQEWAQLADGLEQRARALAAFVADVYGQRRIVEAGVVPARAIESSTFFEPWLMGVDVPTEGWVHGVDVVRCGDGELRVLEDNTRTPSGFAYAVATRAALDHCLPFDPPTGRNEPSEAYDLLGGALRQAERRVVIISDGPGNTAWYEHSEIARALGVPVARPADLLVRHGRLHFRDERGAAHPVDVAYRRTDEDTLRDAAGRPTWLAGALLEPVRRGKLTVVNPLGAGVVDDKLLHAYVEDMVRFYLGEEPAVEGVRTYDLGDPDVLEEVLPRLHELVVKPRDGLGGEGVVICRHADVADREAAERRVRASPGDYIAQETMSISTHPTVVDGRLEARHVDLRPYVIGGGEGATMAPAALTRFALGAGALVVNSSQGGGTKDTWVLP